MDTSFGRFRNLRTRQRLQTRVKTIYYTVALAPFSLSLSLVGCRATGEGSAAAGGATEERAAPPPTATRESTADTLTTAHAVITVSDLTIGSGQTKTAALEVRPAGLWKLNLDYPVRIALSGASYATPSDHSFDRGAVGLQLTSGGLRLDVPFQGDVPGTDVVRAELHFGVCSAYACRAVEEEASFRVTVEIP